MVKRGRKKGKSVFEKQIWHSGRSDIDTEEDIPFDHSLTYDLAKAYVDEYGIKPHKAARIAVGLEYHRYRQALNAFRNVKVSPSAYSPKERKNKRRPKFSRKTKVTIEEITKVVAKKDEYFDPATLPFVSLCEDLPEPEEPWVASDCHMVLRILKRLSRSKKL